MVTEHHNMSFNIFQGSGLLLLLSFVGVMYLHCLELMVVFFLLNQFNFCTDDLPILLLKYYYFMVGSHQELINFLRHSYRVPALLQKTFTTLKADSSDAKQDGSGKDTIHMYVG